VRWNQYRDIRECSVLHAEPVVKFCRYLSSI